MAKKKNTPKEWYIGTLKGYPNIRVINSDYGGNGFRRPTEETEPPTKG